LQKEKKHQQNEKRRGFKESDAEQALILPDDDAPPVEIVPGEEQLRRGRSNSRTA
jgi:hypothetical protein